MQYRSYTPADREAVLALLTEGMTASQVAAKHATFDWQFTQNPHDDGRSPFLIGVENDVVVAVNGMMPARVVFQGQRRQAMWTCDAHVLGTLRGRGIATEMKRLQQEQADVLISYGISDALNSVFDKVGWEASDDLSGYFFHAREPGLKGVLKNLRTSLVRGRRPASHLSPATVTVHSEDDFGGEVDELWQRSLPTYVSAVERDAAYLNWKYRRHPRLSYCWYAARSDDHLLGLLVTRPHGEMSVITDYCGPLDAVDVMNTLVYAAVEDLCRRGTAKILCETTGATMAEALRRNGFRESRGNYRFRALAPRLQVAHPAHGFFIMTGDSDNDFTVAINAPPESVG